MGSTFGATVLTFGSSVRTFESTARAVGAMAGTIEAMAIAVEPAAIADVSTGSMIEPAADKSVKFLSVEHYALLLLFMKRLSVIIKPL
jgi:hypothetical protein